MLTKKDIACSIAEDYDISKRSAVDIVDSVFDKVAESIASGEGINIRNLVTVNLKDRVTREVTMKGRTYPAKKYKAIVAKFSKNLRLSANS